ncbi:response regulator transcription factor [Streptomyces sp. PSAA01]|uniref:response regulator transcription factor n=1 Tax=Streptomyces sp. PSAA01 TaxID=2912762 RepID=UPI001F02A33D|nr:response regulator [Streptomyces sp. PSAA01]MCG0285821.1 response regulator [Streptomyces sp. PSAA01]
MIRVLLADDEHLIRGALASLLAPDDDITVVAETGTGDEALAMARAHRPDAAVLGLRMPGRDGVPVAEIASHAALSPGRVRNYLSATAAELGAENRRVAARTARGRGWL